MCFSDYCPFNPLYSIDFFVLMLCFLKRFYYFPSLYCFSFLWLCFKFLRVVFLSYEYSLLQHSSMNVMSLLSEDINDSFFEVFVSLHGHFIAFFSLWCDFFLEAFLRYLVIIKSGKLEGKLVGTLESVDVVSERPFN